MLVMRVRRHNRPGGYSGADQSRIQILSKAMGVLCDSYRRHEREKAAQRQKRVAEEALRQFCTTVEQALQSQETLAKELADKSAQLYQRIQKLIETSVQSTAPTSTQWTLIAKRAAGGKQSNKT